MADSIAARAARITALQRGRTGARDEREVTRILLDTRGAELTALKNALDGGSDYHDLQQLIFHDIDDEALRAQILDHIAREARSAGEVKILSDIDDTFYSNWKDERYPEKTVYPGVLALYVELDRGPGDTPGRPGDLAFVTARPGDRLGLVEDATRRMLAAHGVPAATVLTGRFTRLLGNRAIAEGKLQNFVQYRALYPEYRFVFIGDSGQGDIRFGQRMIEAAGQAIRAILINDVVTTAPAERAALAAGGVRLFDTYVGAAVEALSLELVSAAGAARIARAAQAEVEAIRFSSAAQAAARREDLSRDTARLNALLPADLRVA